MSLFKKTYQESLSEPLPEEKIREKKVFKNYSITPAEQPRYEDYGKPRHYQYIKDMAAWRKYQAQLWQERILAHPPGPLPQRPLTPPELRRRNKAKAKKMQFEERWTDDISPFGKRGGGI